MKKTILVLLLLSSFIACKKSDDKKEEFKCTTCINAPEAMEAYNQSSAGVYKGVLVGSSGTIALYLFNTGSEVKALITFDGKSGTLTTTSLANWTPGQAISSALFTGTIEGTAVQAIFSVDANGQNPTMQVLIPGHTVAVAVYKETSTNLIKSFEGIYTGDRNGIFNITFSGNDYTLISDGGGDFIVNTLINGEVNINEDGTILKGTFQGQDAISGTWKNDKNQSGTWSGHRTL